MLRIGACRWDGGFELVDLFLACLRGLVACVRAFWPAISVIEPDFLSLARLQVLVCHSSPSLSSGIGKNLVAGIPRDRKSFEDRESLQPTKSFLILEDRLQLG